MYTVVGITGKVGGATARALLKAGKKVRVVAAALRQALDAARPAKVVALSSVGAHRPRGLGLITQCYILEQEIKTVPLPKAFIRAAWFMENAQWDVASARDRGEIASFLAPLDQPYPMIATGDIGELAAQILQEAWTGNRCVELEGPARYSQLNVAKTFSRLLNRTVTAKPVPRAEWAALFETQGTQADRTAPRIEMLEGFNSGWIAFEGTGTEHFRSRRTLEEVFQDLLRQEA
jgi:NAD(P)H dehydrogenase (quinone)